MPDDEKIKELACAIWDKDGRPEGKEAEYDLRAKQILEEQEAAQSSKTVPTTPNNEMESLPKTFEITAKTRRRRGPSHPLLVLIVTLLSCTVMVLMLHIIHVLPLPPVVSENQPSIPIYTPTDRGWLGNW